MRKGWEYKKLGEVCVYPSKRIQVSELNPKDYVGVENLQKDRAGVVFSDKMPNTNSAIAFSPNDILIGNIRPYLKKIWLADKSGGASGDVVIIRISTNDLLPMFLYKVLASDHFFEYDNTFTKGAKMPRGDRNAIAEFMIPLPPKSTQLAIVSELDKINDLIRLKKEQLKDFDNLAQSLFYEMFGDPVENEKGWKVKKLGEICTDITDGDHMPPPKSEFGIPFITISDIDKDTRCLNFENTFYVPEDYYNNLKENRKPQKGDLLYTVTGSYGIPVIVKTDKKFCFQRHIALLRPNKEILSTIFLCYWVLSDGVKFMADKVATGIAQKTVGLNSIRKFSCILPPLSLQRLFAQRIEQIEREKSEVQKSIQDLETLLASRMQYWFE